MNQQVMIGVGLFIVIATFQLIYYFVWDFLITKSIEGSLMLFSVVNSNVMEAGSGKDSDSHHSGIEAGYDTFKNDQNQGTDDAENQALMGDENVNRHTIGAKIPEEIPEVPSQQEDSK